MALRTNAYQIFSNPSLRAHVYAYLIRSDLDAPYSQVDLDQLHLPSSYGAALRYTEAREVYRDQAYLIRATVTWAIPDLQERLPVSGFRLRFEPLAQRDDWRNVGWRKLPEPRILVDDLNTLTVSFMLTAMKRPGG